MLEVADALEKVLAECGRTVCESVPLSQGLGLTLAEDVTSDVDSPPHDKSIVDGFAIVAASLASETPDFQIGEEITAGQVPQLAVTAGVAARIMTGAPIPAGADAVVMVEKTELVEGSLGTRVRILETGTKAGQNIVRKGTSIQAGAVVLRQGTLLGASQIGLLAEVGCTQPRVYKRPTVAVLATGNELVPADQKPIVGTIRNSNGPMIEALVTQAGGIPVGLGIARDEEAALRERIEAGLAADVLLLSGGVSAGVLDLVPKVLASLGVIEVFHKVNLKPGKPLWFGVCQREGRRTLVFGLPGNPVSSLVCFELFVRPALAQLTHGVAWGLPEVWGSLTSEHRQRGDRPTYWPVSLLRGSRAGAGDISVVPLKWQGSGDLFTLGAANGLAYFEPMARTYAVGEKVRVLRLSRG